MLQINLIPRSFFERRAIQRLMTALGAVLGLVIIAVLASIFVIQSRTAKAREAFAIADPIATQVETLKSEATALRSEVQPLKDRIKFINDVQAFNVSYLPVLQDLIKYTYHTIEFQTIVPESGGAAAGAGGAAPAGVDTLRITGFAPSITDLGKFLVGMYRANHLFSSVSLSGPPGWGDSSGQSAGGSTESGVMRLPFEMVCRLVKPIAPPTPPAAGASPDAAAAAAGQAPGAAPPLQ